MAVISLSPQLLKMTQILNHVVHLSFGSLSWPINLLVTASAFEIIEGKLDSL